VTQSRQRQGSPTARRSAPLSTHRGCASLAVGPNIGGELCSIPRWRG
jgi:hypothetical protein